MAELEELESAAKKSGALVRVGYNHRYHPACLKALELFRRVISEFSKGETRYWEQAQQAIKDGLDKKGDAPALMELSKMQMLQQAASEAYLKDRKPTDAEVKAE